MVRTPCAPRSRTRFARRSAFTEQLIIMSDSPPTTFDPFEHFVPLRINDAVKELQEFIDAFRAGTDLIMEQRPTAQVLLGNRSATQLPPDDPLKTLFERCDSLEALARPHIDDRFAFLYNTAVVRLWAVLEGVIDDFLVFLLLHHDPARRSQPLKRIKGPLVEFRQLGDDDQAAVLVDMLLDDLRAKFQPGVGRFESALGALNLGGPVDPSVRRILVELAEARHVIVHRRDRIDKRFLEKCPWVRYVVGDSLRTDALSMHIYMDAAQWYGLALCLRWLEAAPTERRVGSEGLQRVRDGLTQGADRLESMLTRRGEEDL